MDAILSRLAELEARTETQGSTITRLSSLDEAHTASIAHLTTENARLSADNIRLSYEVAQLRKTAEEQKETQNEISLAALPGGHWAWEAGQPDEGGEVERGRWLWSLESYRAAPRVLAAYGPPASLDTLPVEVFGIVLDDLSRAEQATLSRVNYRCLQLASSRLYQKAKADMQGAMLLLSSRLRPCTPRSERVSRLLTFDTVLWTDYPSPRRSSKLPATAVLVARLPPPTSGQLIVRTLAFYVSAERRVDDALSQWTPFLRLFDPVTLQITRRAAGSVLPSLRVVSHPFSFADNWARLCEVTICGRKNMLVHKDSPLRPCALDWLGTSSVAAAETSLPKFWAELETESRSLHLPLKLDGLVDGWAEKWGGVLRQALAGGSKVKTGDISFHFYVSR